MRTANLGALQLLLSEKSESLSMFEYYALTELLPGRFLTEATQDILQCNSPAHSTLARPTMGILVLPDQGRTVCG